MKHTETDLTQLEGDPDVRANVLINDTAISFEMGFLGSRVKFSSRGGPRTAIGLAMASSLLLVVRSAVAIGGGSLAHLAGAPWWASVGLATALFGGLLFVGSVQEVPRDRDGKEPGAGRSGRRHRGRPKGKRKRRKSRR